MRSEPFPYLLLPHVWAARNRIRVRQRGDSLRALLFGGVGIAVCAVLFWGAYWVTTQLGAYEEFGDYLLRLGLSWLFLTFLAFLAFSGIGTALSTFFLADDLRLLMASPVAARRLFLARFARTVVQASWMVVIFIAPVLAGVVLRWQQGQGGGATVSGWWCVSSGQTTMRSRQARKTAMINSGELPCG